MGGTRYSDSIDERGHGTVTYFLVFPSCRMAIADLNCDLMISLDEFVVGTTYASPPCNPSAAIPSCNFTVRVPADSLLRVDVEVKGVDGLPEERAARPARPRSSKCLPNRILDPLP